MKTAIDIPEDLLHRAKIAAAQRKSTLKELVLQGLDYMISHPSRDPEVEQREEMVRILERMRASNKGPMTPLKRDEIYDG